MNEHVLRCRQMIEEQITQLGTLRNANPRDPSFKLWRQNTLTVLQRVWPGDSTRSERFRRIPFSPTQGKSDAEALRDWFGRGCIETTAYLKALLEMVDREGVPPAPDVMPEALPSSSDLRDDDYPVLDLPSGVIAPKKPAVQGKSDSLADMAAMPGTEGSRESGAPAPRQLRVELKGPVTTPRAPQSVSMQRPAALQAEQAKHVPQEKAASSAIPPAPVVAPIVAPVVAPIVAPAPITPATPVATPEAAQTVVKRPARPAKVRRAASKLKLKDMLGLGSLDEVPLPKPEPVVVPEPVAAAPPPVAAEPPPAPQPAPQPAPAAEEDHDFPDFNDAEAAQATQDFLRMSPVLGLQGRPVQRTSDDTGFADPDAIAVATLAADAGRLGVSDDSRDKLRSALLELARGLESQSPQWSALQSAITLSMEYPEVARRLLPVVLPWMHRAA